MPVHVTAKSDGSSTLDARISLARVDPLAFGTAIDRGDHPRDGQALG